MQQIVQIKDGVLDYSLVRGQTGPLVYPGGHVVIFEWLYDHFPEVKDAQWVYMAVYLTTQAGVFAVYYNANLPWYYWIVAVLSKRLHSIYLLRLFNDCWCVLFSVFAVLCVQLDLHLMASILFSLAISIKMSALLWIPGLLIVWWTLFGLRMFAFGAVAAVPQAAVAWRFRDYAQQYVRGAFELSRQFMYKWTVNWRFVPQHVFSSAEFAHSLLAAHASLLLALARRNLGRPMTTQRRTRVLVVSNLIGVLCARSLHYQFYSWFYWTVPLLLASLPGPLKAVWIALEAAWLTFPATPMSSAAHVAAAAVLLAFNL